MEARLPYGPTSYAKRNCSLKSMHNARNSLPFRREKEQVTVIGHDDKRKKIEWMNLLCLIERQDCLICIGTVLKQRNSVLYVGGDKHDPLALNRVSLEHECSLQKFCLTFHAIST